jgi:hypothetical protein
MAKSLKFTVYGRVPEVRFGSWLPLHSSHENRQSLDITVIQRLNASRQASNQTAGDGRRYRGDADRLCDVVVT